MAEHDRQLQIARNVGDFSLKSPRASAILQERKTSVQAIDHEREGFLAARMLAEQTEESSSHFNYPKSLNIFKI